MTPRILSLALALNLSTLACAAPPAPPPAPAPPRPAAAPTAPLSAAEQARLQREMADLQRQMQDLGRRMGEIGTQLGQNQQRIVMQRLGGERIGLGVVLGESTAGGARIAAVTPGSPAEKAGLRTGDIIRSAHGREVDSPQALTDALRGIQKGQAVNVRYVRDGRPAAVVVVADRIGEAASFRWLSNVEFDPDGPLGGLAGPGRTMVIEGGGPTGASPEADVHRRIHVITNVPQSQDPQARMGGHGNHEMRVHTCINGVGECDVTDLRQAFRFSGLNLTNLDAQLGRYFGTTEGVLVISASDALPGVQSGDVIQSLDGQPVRFPGEVMRVLRDKDAGAQVAAKVMRDRSVHDIRITVPEGRPLDFLPPPPPPPPAPPAPPAPPPPPAGLPL